MTNLDIAKKYFKKASFNDNEYELNDEFIIVWVEGEVFVVERCYLDLDVGYVTNDVFSGDFRQCLEFCLGEKLTSKDAEQLEKLKASV